VHTDQGTLGVCTRRPMHSFAFGRVPVVSVTYLIKYNKENRVLLVSGEFLGRLCHRASLEVGCSCGAPNPPAAENSVC
jgi:hypothetical protein